MAGDRSTITVLLLLIGLGLILSGMMSSSIVKVCHMTFTKVKPSPQLAPFMMHQKDRRNHSVEICIGQGLFAITFSFSDMSLSISTPLENGNVIVRTVAGLLLLGCIGSVLSALVFIQSACNAGYENNYAIYNTIKRGAIATVIQFINVAVILSALSMFTNYKIKTIGNPRQFLAQTSHALTGWEILIEPEQVGSNNRDISKPKPFMTGPPRFLANRRPLPFMNHLPNLLGNNFSHILPFQNSTLRTQSLLNLFVNIQKLSSSVNGQKNETENTKPSTEEASTIPSSSEENSFGSELAARKNRKKRNLGFPLVRGLPSNRGLPDITSLGMRLMSRLKTSKPTLGYSFYLLWAGLAFQIFALIGGIRTWKLALNEKQLIESTNLK